MSPNDPVFDEISDYDDLAKQLAQSQQRVASLISFLAECYRLSGADPDGNEDWRLAPHAVTEVRRMREEYDAMQQREAELNRQVELLTWADSCKGKQLLEFGEEINRRGDAIIQLKNWIHHVKRAVDYPTHPAVEGAKLDAG